MKTPESPLHHSLLFSARSDTPGKEGETAWTMEFTVFRSRNGFRRHAEWTGIFERRSRDSDQLLRKVFRRTLSFPSGLEQPERLLESPWACEGIRFDGRRYSGSIAASDGDLNWNFEIDGGEDLAFRPLERWLPWRTVRTRAPVRGSWSLATLSADGKPFAAAQRTDLTSQPGLAAVPRGFADRVYGDDRLLHPAVLNGRAT